MSRPHPYDRLTRLATPREGMGIASASAYAARHLQQMRSKQQALPALEFRDPWPAPDGAVPFATGGKWVVACPCGDYPMASPEWNEARCFACGAIYAALQWPADRVAIEAELVKRPALVRAWVPGESLDDLRLQNVANGVMEAR